jgi:hypothetical protein
MPSPSFSGSFDPVMRLVAHVPIKFILAALEKHHHDRPSVDAYLAGQAGTFKPWRPVSNVPGEDSAVI